MRATDALGVAGLSVLTGGIVCGRGGVEALKSERPKSGLEEAEVGGKVGREEMTGE